MFALISDAAMYTNHSPARKMMNPAALFSPWTVLVRNLGGEDSALQSAPKLRKLTKRRNFAGEKHAKNPQRAAKEPSSSIMMSKSMVFPHMA